MNLVSEFSVLGCFEEIEDHGSAQLTFGLEYAFVKKQKAI